MTSKKKVLVVSQHFWPETFRINDICDYMTENGFDVEVLCGLPNYPKGELLDGYSFFRNRKQVHKGIKIHRASEITRGNSNIRIFLNYISFPISSLFQLPRLLTNHYDSIFLYQTSPVIMSLTGILLSKIKKIDSTLYVLDLWPENLYSVLPIKSRFLRHIIESISRWHYRNADKLIVLSESMRQRLIEITGKSEKDIIILPQSCEKIYETNVQDKELVQCFRKGFNIVFTGSITPAQSFDTVIEAASILQRRGVKEVNWIIVGDGMSLEDVKKSVKNANLSEIFHFEGQKPVEDMPKYTYIADVLIGCLVKSNLLEATIPAKVMSYIASGRPIVLAMDGEVQKLINETIKCGYVGPTEDGKILADNIERIHSLSIKDREKMGSRARAYHFKHFERSIILSRLLAFINK